MGDIAYMIAGILLLLTLLKIAGVL
jgi:hypothetical protein